MPIFARVGLLGRSFLVLSCLGVALPAASVPAIALAAAEAERTVVDVELELRAGDAVIGSTSRRLELDHETKLDLDDDGHAHNVKLKVRKVEGSKLSLQLSYERDGATMIERVEVQASADQPKIVRSKDGSVALSLVLAPKAIAKKIDAPTTNDPLAGV
jgi:hypothetical protein